VPLCTPLPAARIHVRATAGALRWRLAHGIAVAECDYGARYE
jgi:hypothetical protein